MPDTMHEDLFKSARRWAQTALDAYTDPADHDFAVHHMAVADEHLSKSYLSSITEVLLVPDRPSIDDLLVLGGHEGKAGKGRAGLRTIGGAEAVARAEKVLGKPARRGGDLKLLRDTRNGITHMGWGQPASACRDLLAAGIMFVEDLLAAMPRSPESFWGHHLELSKQLVQESITELQIRYDSKIRRAKHVFEKRFSSASDEERAEVIRSLTALPVWGLVVPATCPACDSPGGVRGRDWSGDYGDVWFLPRHFTCPVCELDLSRDELELAGISAQLLDGHEEDPDWQPDFD